MTYALFTCFSTAVVNFSFKESSSNTVGTSQRRIHKKDDGTRRTECQFFQGTTARLRVQEEDNEELEKDPTAVDGEVLPREGIERNRVDIGGEETGKLAKDLLNTDATAAVGVWPELDQIRCIILEREPIGVVR